MVRVVQFLLAVCLVWSSSPVFASEIKELARSLGPRTPSGVLPVVDRVLCIDGLKVFQTVAFGYGNGSGAAVSNLQLMEEKNGKVVPVRCKSEKK